MIIKQGLIIFRRPDEWSQISARLVQDFGPSIMISWKLKRELSINVRRHKGLVKHGEEAYEGAKDAWLPDELKNRYHYEDQIHLDFFDEAAQSWFILKYL